MKVAVFVVIILTKVSFHAIADSSFNHLIQMQVQNFLAEPVGRMVGRYPESYEQIIQQNIDISPDQLKIVAEQSEAYWKSDISVKDPVLALGKIDLSTLRDLNLLSSDLWKLLLKCNDGDVNLVRLKIWTRKEFCKNQEMNSAVEKSFLELSQNFQAYLIALPFLTAATAGVYVSGAFKILHMHPLLVQMLIVIKSIFMNHVLEKRNYLTEVMDHMSFKFGSANLVGLLTYNLPRKLLESQAAETKIDHFAVYKVYVNSLALLRYLSPAIENTDSACQIYGLWPAVNRIILYQTHLWNRADNDINRHLIALEARVVVHCGPIVRATPNKNSEFEIYGNAGFSHLYAMKSLYMKWLGRFWEN